MSGSDSELHVGMRFSRQERDSVLGYPGSDALFWTISGMVLIPVSLRFKSAAQVIPKDSRLFLGTPLDISINLIPHPISDPHAMARFPRRVQSNGNNRRDSCASSMAEFCTSSLSYFISLSTSLPLLCHWILHLDYANIFPDFTFLPVPTSPPLFRIHPSLASDIWVHVFRAYVSCVSL